MNTSAFPISKTASTKFECAKQRAENLAILGAKNVIELCCGPSLPVLHEAYKKYGIKVTGNDIDTRYSNKFIQYNWINGNCLDIDVSSFDFVVFAPPLSKGCSGKREDSLSINEVTPSYSKALDVFTNKNLCLVLPGRTLSLKKDRESLYQFLSMIEHEKHVICLKDKVTKYIDIYVMAQDVSSRGR